MGETKLKPAVIHLVSSSAQHINSEISEESLQSFVLFVF